MIHRTWPGRRPAGRFLLLAVLALGYVLATIRQLPVIVLWGTTHSGTSATALAADLAAGLGLVIVGLFLAAQPTGRRVGLLVTLAGITWFASDWVGWQEGTPTVRSVATLIAPFFAPVILHIVALLPRGRSPSPAMSGLLAAGYLVTGLVALALAAADDPLTDPTCWQNCTDTVLLVTPMPDLAALLRVAQVLTATTIGLIAARVCVARLAGSTTAVRRVVWPVLIPGCAVGLLIAAEGVARLVRPLVDPRSPLDASLFLALAWSVAAFAGGLAWLSLRSRQVHSELTHLVGELGERPAPGTVTAALSRAIGDPAVAVTYRLERPERWVDSGGSAVDPARADEGHAVTRVVRDGELVALIRHDTHLVDPQRLEQQLGPAARLAIENERLGAEVLSRLQELQHSRARIVAAGDAERRRLERDLHDGAQQRLLALAYDLRVARTVATQDGQVATASILDGAIADARACHAELRELAHGIYPAILAEAGLEIALQTLADRAPVALSLTMSPQDPCGAQTDPALYAVVDEAITEAGARGATRATVAIDLRDGDVTVTIDDDGAARPLPPVHLADRVGAAGGRLTLGSAGALPNRLEAAIPCA